MNIGTSIHKIRNDAKLTQAQLAEIVGVSQQSVQKWESGTATPDLDKIIRLAKYFDVSLDSLVLGNDSRAVAEMTGADLIEPQYQIVQDQEFYASNLATEYQQSIDEGLDIEVYKDLFSAVSRLPKNEIKKKFGDALFDLVRTAKQREGYRYVEPSTLEQIKSLRRGNDNILPFDEDALEEKISGAWRGRIAGCMLGKTVEGVRTNELHPFLKETGNFPMYRYIQRTDLTQEILDKYTFRFSARYYADRIDSMPVDDDTNYTVLAQELIQSFGRDFTPLDVATNWLKYQRKAGYCTAEQVAFCNFIKGFAPPQSAMYQNPYREWIGAQIRGDYYGYINPGNPALAAEMAWRDASISHIKNGIYGEMMIAAMIAAAASTNDIEQIVSAGLAQIPCTSRLYEEITSVLEGFRSGTSQTACFESIHEKYDEYTQHGWCHTNSNAMIVVASLLYGGGDFGKSICMAVETGFDTDCNGATVGSILGMANGIRSIPECWTKPFNDTLHTGLYGFETVRISDRIARTLEHIKK
ncbi:MAG: ADP-ribosylglycohydrolase family protein [Clostridia bacterium]|nr:ADP-ribosylglycohydrolase family protein [Clostridia bacterium]